MFELLDQKNGWFSYRESPFEETQMTNNPVGSNFTKITGQTKVNYNVMHVNCLCLSVYKTK
jgi:hypothetical protein